jgi:alkylresorcinol/alkylpyrone synthase
VDLFAQAAEAALAEAGLPARDVDVIVTVSSTGHRDAQPGGARHGPPGFPEPMRRACRCSAGLRRWGTGWRWPRGWPGRAGTVVLFVCVEICSLAFRIDEPSKADIVATALFGDGAAACVLRAGRGRFRRGHRRGRAHLARHPGHHGLAGRSRPAWA